MGPHSDATGDADRPGAGDGGVLPAEAAPALVQRGSAAQLLIQHCYSIDTDTGALTPRATVRLLHAALPVTRPQQRT